MLPIWRPLVSNTRTCVPHAEAQGHGYWDQYPLLRAGAVSLALPGTAPLMTTGNGGAIPAAQDPTDPRTWRTPVVFT